MKMYIAGTVHPTPTSIASFTQSPTAPLWHDDSVRIQHIIAQKAQQQLMSTLLVKILLLFATQNRAGAASVASHVRHS